MCQSYDCLGDRQQLCRIDHTLRLNCRSCRLTKCLQAGMHKDLVQAKREVKFELQSRSAIKVRQDDLGIYQPGTSSANDYTPKFSEMFYLSSENEWTHSPTKKRPLKSTTDIMGIEELQQFIKIPCDYTDNSEHSNKKINSMGLELFSLEEQERIYGVTALYTDLVIQLNSRRKITYTNNPLGTMFDEACVCPYRKTDLKLFHHRTYRSKNRNDYTMILDYVNRFPEFALLSKSEKTVLFRTAAAVDVLVDQAYYSES
uniref:Nuclear receptor domain-containing protein n=1 Tax=Caenorhabditis japonica TaxID=281687 RepID=A0A8R1DT77_CAEJA